MCEELNYPVKYAVLELKESGGYLFGYKDITKGYIVSKCYVLESSIKFYANGDNKTFYTVFFPFKDISDFKMYLNLGEGKKPSYDTFDHPLDSDVVSELFDTFDEASLLASQKNKEIKEELEQNLLSANLEFKPLCKEFLKEFQNNLIMCEKFEQLVLLKTKDMNVSSYQASEIGGYQLKLK